MLPSKRPQCTLLAETLVIIPVVTAMLCAQRWSFVYFLFGNFPNIQLRKCVYLHNNFYNFFLLFYIFLMESIYIFLIEFINIFSVWESFPIPISGNRHPTWPLRKTKRNSNKVFALWKEKTSKSRLSRNTLLQIHFQKYISGYTLLEIHLWKYTFGNTSMEIYFWEYTCWKYTCGITYLEIHF